MKQRIAFAGVVLLLALVPMALVGAGKRAADPPAGKGHVLQVGKTYCFVFAGGPDQSATYTVQEEPRDGWVRVGLPERDSGGSQLVPTWINLQTVAQIEYNPDNQ